MYILSMCECGIWFMEVDISVMKEKLVFKAVASKVALNPIINNIRKIIPQPTIIGSKGSIRKLDIIESVDM